MAELWGFVGSILAGVLFLAGTLKLLDSTAFETFLRAQGMSGSIGRWLARGVALSELIVSVALVAMPNIIGARVAAVVLTGLFVGALTAGRLRAADVPCGCFGSLESQLGAPSIARASLLFAMAIGLLIGYPSGDQTAEPSIRFVGLATGTLGVLASLIMPRLLVVTVRTETKTK